MKIYINGVHAFALMQSSQLFLTFFVFPFFRAYYCAFHAYVITLLDLICISCDQFVYYFASIP